MGSQRTGREEDQTQHHIIGSQAGAILFSRVLMPAVESVPEDAQLLAASGILD